jgi:hypothetical protein
MYALIRSQVEHALRTGQAGWVSSGTTSFDDMEIREVSFDVVSDKASGANVTTAVIDMHLVWNL